MGPTCLVHRTIFRPNTIGYISLSDCEQWPDFDFRQRHIFLCIFYVPNISVPISALYTAGKPVARGVQVGALHQLKIWMHPLRICKMPNTNALTRSLKNVSHPAAFTCCLCWIAVVGKNSFSKTYVHVRCFVPRYTARYVIKVLTLWSWQRHFFTLVHLLQACIYMVLYLILWSRQRHHLHLSICTCIYIYTRYMYNRVLGTYLHVCT